MPLVAAEMTTGAGSPWLLAALSGETRDALTKVAQNLDFAYGDVVIEPGQRIEYVYFPLTAFFSQLVPANSHGNLELALVGREGMVGTELVLDVAETHLQTLVQGEGDALRVEAQVFVDLLEAFPDLRRHIHRYVHIVMTQLALTIVCNSFHSLTARLARWLLQTDDRACQKSFRLTHEFLAQMLGVRRVGITNAASTFRKKALIAYDRGEVTVLDRKGLEHASCSCYPLSADLYRRVLGPPSS